MTSHVQLLTDEGIGTVTIDRPDALNALSVETLQELLDAFTALSAEWQASPGTLRGVILMGAGSRAFVAGADIRAMAAMDREEAFRMGALGQAVTAAIEALPVPVIAAVDGVALGGGCELAMACDVILATEQSRFGQPEVKLGLMTGFGGAVRLPRYVGLARAKDLLYSGRIIDAETARQYGLVLEVVDTRDALDRRARALLAEYAANSPSGIGATKLVLDRIIGESTRDALAIELDSFANRFDTADKAEGTSAFLEKRPPLFG
ncbi:MAG TPA: enoyl-CoA hydratase-related protein [Microbacteriaceae bacterium]|nr:enoyl-CoA hydratase-related protein [Microbacteriaceae bacterium]